MKPAGAMSATRASAAEAATPATPPPPRSSKSTCRMGRSHSRAARFIHHERTSLEWREGPGLISSNFCSSGGKFSTNWFTGSDSVDGRQVAASVRSIVWARLSATALSARSVRPDARVAHVRRLEAWISLASTPQSRSATAGARDDQLQAPHGPSLDVSGTARHAEPRADRSVTARILQHPPASNTS